MASKDRPLTSDLDANEGLLRTLFADCSDVIFRRIPPVSGPEGLLLYVDGLVEAEQLNDNILTPLLNRGALAPELAVGQVKSLTRCADVVSAVLEGQAVLLRAGEATAASLGVRGGTRRSVEEPKTEIAIRGPREGFTENLRTNTALLRFKIKSAKLKMEQLVIGEQTQTRIVLAYLANVADSKVVDEVRRRLKSIKIDAILESGYIEEMIEDSPFSPFPQLQYTERPDTAAAQLLEGRFVILVDGTPMVLSGPVVAWQLLQASEDYYERFLIGTLIRWLRFAFAFLSLYLPALYVAISTFHPDMLPTTLMLSVAAARESIPFPAIVEAIIMEISFEALREAGIRLPRTVGQAVSILGALVIGQAAVEAGIVSAPMVIIVSLTGIASFTIPHFNAAIALRMLRFPLMFLSAGFGIFGLVIGTLLIGVHLCHLRSFGVPYLSGWAPARPDDLKDVLVRAPWWGQLRRPRITAARDLRRLAEGQKPTPPPRR